MVGASQREQTAKDPLGGTIPAGLHLRFTKVLGVVSFLVGVCYHTTRRGAGLVVFRTGGTEAFFGVACSESPIRRAAVGAADLISKKEPYSPFAVQRKFFWVVAVGGAIYYGAKLGGGFFKQADHAFKGRFGLLCACCHLVVVFLPLLGVWSCVSFVLLRFPLLQPPRAHKPRR